MKPATLCFFLCVHLTYAWKPANSAIGMVPGPSGVAPAPQMPQRRQSNLQDLVSQVVCEYKNSAPRTSDMHRAKAKLSESANKICAPAEDLCSGPMNNACLEREDNTVQLAEHGSAVITITGVRGRLEMPCALVATALDMIEKKCAENEPKFAGTGQVRGFAVIESTATFKGWGKVWVDSKK